MFNNMVRVNFENKEEMLVPVGTQAIDVVARCFNKKDNVIAVRVNNKVHSLNYKIVSDCIISVITYYDTEGHKIYTRSLKLLFMMAVRITRSGRMIMAKRSVMRKLSSARVTEVMPRM